MPKLVKCPWENFYEVSLSSWAKLGWKTSLLLIYEHVQVFLKTLTADLKHSLCYIFNVQVLYQTQLSKKLKISSQYFSPFSNSSSNFEHFEKKYDVLSQCFYELIDCQRYGQTNVRLASFQSTVWQRTCQSIPNTYPICMKALLSYFFLTVSQIHLVEISFSDILTLSTLC